MRREQWYAEGTMTAEQRSQRVEASIRHAEERQPEYLKRSLEVSLKGRLDRPVFVTVAKGSTTPVVLEMRPYYNPADSLWHTGLFDPQGAPDAMPLRVSEIGW